MWLNAFEFDDKIMSPTELLILTTVPDSYINTKDIVIRLADRVREWNPAPGTVYPILHRLEENNLLEKTRGKRINFRRTEKARVFLSSILKPLRTQIKETNTYYLAIIQSIINVVPTPIGIEDFIEGIQHTTKQFLIDLNELLEIAKKMEDEDAFDVPISFE